MGRPALELADIVREHGVAYWQQRGVTYTQLRVLRAIASCRTAVLGGHVERCDQCHQERTSYHSCRNRHCPKCGSQARARWLHQRQAELLPVEYFHVVFTLPEAIAEVARQNQRVVYDLLFRISLETMQTIARDPRHLGAEIGCFGILHTWGQNLLHHPHVHYVIAGGGISPDHDRWISCRPGFFLPVRVLSEYFRNHFLCALEKLHRQGKLQFSGSLSRLRERTAFAHHLDPLRQSPWVVYAKPPFGGPQQVLEYLGRYTHRVAISNHRLVSFANGQVTFRWKDYRHEQRPGLMTLSADEFLRRFLLHTLPDGFQRIRFGGFFANCHRKSKLALVRQLLAMPVTELLPLPKDCAELLAWLTGVPAHQCPHCRVGQMHVVATLAPVPLDSS
jgi:hypothetical protein